MRGLRTIAAVVIQCLGVGWMLCAAFAQAAPVIEDEDWPLGSRLLDSFAAGHYARVVAEGPKALEQEPDNDALRLAYANSLLWTGQTWNSAEHFQKLVGTAQDQTARLGLAHALSWTGRMAQAIPFYESLLDGPVAHDARLGLANALRWSGRADRALPHYQRAMNEEPTSKDAIHGVVYSERALRATTAISAQFAQENNTAGGQELVLKLSHSLRNDEKTRIYTLDISRAVDRVVGLTDPAQAFSFEVEDLEMALAPRLRISREVSPNETWLGQLRLKLGETPLYVNIGRISWPKTPLGAQNLDVGITANQLGLEGKYQTGIGEFRGSVNQYALSDGNQIHGGDLRLTPWRTPFGREIRPYAGLAWRATQTPTPNYWSPENYVVGYVGIEGEWETPEWYVFTFLTLGDRLAGDGSRYWSAGLNAKHWFRRDMALGAGLWSQSSLGEGSYQVYGLNMQLEKQW
jgi:tetratricopeptide (TPR) repeat protein